MDFPVVYLEIAGPDAAALKAFYADVFGWRMDGAKRPGYGFVPLAEAGGVLWGIREDPADKVIYIQVSDLQATLDAINAHGGETVVPPTEVPGVVTFALFNDPAGNRMGLVLKGGH
jgi:predicted enzyme related to lactoylglutathione lyase